MNISFNSNILSLKARRQKFGIGSVLISFFIGGILFFGGVLALKSNEFDSTWKKVDGEVVGSHSEMGSKSTTYSPIVQYRVNGQLYKVASSMSSSSYPSMGEKREVAYNPERPDQSKVIESFGSLWWVYLLPTAGVVMVLMAPIFYLQSAKRGSDIDRLIRSGQKLQAVLVDIQSTGSSGSGEYKIVVAATDSSGLVQNYISDNLTNIGGLAMSDYRNNPILIDVYIDPMNTQKYYVDISDIPNLTPDRIGELIKSTVQKKQTSTFTDTGKTPPFSEN